MAISVRDEGAKVNSNINVTPMVDVMLVLLIIFMVITPMLQKDVSVDLAQVNNPLQMKDADKDDALVVAITRDGAVYFGTCCRRPLPPHASAHHDFKSLSSFSRIRLSSGPLQLRSQEH